MNSVQKILMQQRIRRNLLFKSRLTACLLLLRKSESIKQKIDELLTNGSVAERASLPDFLNISMQWII